MKTNFLRRIVSEPLVHFVGIGWVLFVVGDARRSHNDTYRITMTPQREAHLATRYEMQFGRAPDTETLAQLVQQDIDEEILFRRGLALQLEQGDEIVRRRIVQKMQFLLQDLNAPAEPSDAELSNYYHANAARYAEPPHVTFSHLYFAADEGDEAARTRAQAALSRLERDPADVANVGSPFPDLSHFSAYDPDQVRRLFGQTEFSDAAFTAPLKQWVGPYRSGYGWHLIRVEAREPAQQPPLSAVRDKVRTDYLLATQARANAVAFDDVAREFTVVRPQS